MLACSIDLWPHGNPARAEHLGAVLIANDGTGTSKFGNYHCALTHSGRYVHRKGPWRDGRVEGHRRALSPYHLVLKAMEACLKRGPAIPKPWSRRATSTYRSIRDKAPPTAAEIMRSWLEGEEAQQPPEALVEESTFPPTVISPEPLDGLVAAVEDLLDITAEQVPTHRVDSREYWRTVTDCVRTLRRAHRRYCDDIRENSGGDQEGA